MRKKIKISFLLLLSFIGLVFVSCELQEEAIHQHEHNSNLKLYEMKFEELMTNKKFVNSFSKLPKSKRSITNATLGRTVMENEYGFTIANKPAKVIENNGETSYTFLITRDTTNTDSFENLVIQTDSSNTTKAVIIKYNLTSPITSSEDNSYSFSSNSEITPIVYNNTTVSESSKMIIICYWITTTYCNYGGSEHVAGANCTASYKYNRSRYHCTAGDDGTMDAIPSDGGGGSDGGGSTTSTGSNYDGSDTSIHGNGSNSLNTAPVAPEAEVENPLDCVTKEKLHEIFPSSSLENRTKLADNIRIYGGYFGINTKEEVCHFLAQVGAETGGLTTLNATENLNYTTASRLVQVFPSKFSLITHPTKVSPIPYLSNPSGLANLVYCCQFGNGDVASGDGWRYRGRGILQLTWAGNYNGYQNYLSDIGLGWFYTSPDDLSNPDGIHSVLSGMWFFKKNVLDKMTINNTTPVKKVTKKINPALKKLNERKNYFNKANSVLNC